MLILGIDTTCDDTGVGIVEDGVRIRSNIIASQHASHERWGGIVPMIAARQHVKNVSPIVAAALDEGHETIGVIYGAGHMRDLETRLAEELGYAPVSTEWLRAASVQYAELDLDRDQVRMLRRAVADGLDDALGR